jgi:dissimilatory sulfite reductase (desulfoviridin) alpha/beta subunit
MQWEKDAEEAVAKVPFFVRSRVKKRVEEEAARLGAAKVGLAHVRACQERFMNKQEDEITGWQVETCFGASGCPNRAIAADELPAALSERISRRNLKEFLRERVRGPLKFHHEFRVSISDCPNACSRPQIADLGLIGASRPEITNEHCIECMACVHACREGAVTLPAKVPFIDAGRCVSCGQCARACAPGTIVEGQQGFRVLVGGKLGRHPRLARELPGIHRPAAVLEIVECCLDHYQRHSTRGERFGEVLEATGLAELEACIADRLAALPPEVAKVRERVRITRGPA